MKKPNEKLHDALPPKNREYRCHKCRRLLFVGKLENGHVEIKCAHHNCKSMNSFVDSVCTS